MSKLTLTLSQFAHDLGAHQRLTRDVSLVWHKQYVSADVVTRRAMREEFLTAFVRGYCGGEKSHSNLRHAEMAANQKFKYHISRDGAKDKPTQAKQPHNRISASHRQAAMEFLGHFDGESLQEQIKQALAVLKAL